MTLMEVENRNVSVALLLHVADLAKFPKIHQDTQIPYICRLVFQCRSTYNLMITKSTIKQLSVQLSVVFLEDQMNLMTSTRGIIYFCTPGNGQEAFWTQLAFISISNEVELNIQREFTQRKLQSYHAVHLNLIHVSVNVQTFSGMFHVVECIHDQ